MTTKKEFLIWLALILLIVGMDYLVNVVLK